MTVSEYAEKHGLSQRAVYHAVYDGRIRFSRESGRLVLDDFPPTVSSRFRRAEELTELPEYILALIWLNGTISGDAILIRSKRPEIPEIIASAIRSSIWQREGKRSGRVCKICSAEICGALRELGFSGRKDTDRYPPPVSEAALAKAMFESHSTFAFALQYDRHAMGDKSRAYYTPCVSLCAAPSIISALSLSLASLGVAPLKRSAKAANGKSAIYRMTSRAQFVSASSVLSPEICGAGDRAFWERFDHHVSQRCMPYDVYHAQRARETTLDQK